MRKAAAEPLRWIAENAGLEGYVVVDKVRGLPAGHGLDAATGEYADLLARGIIDPVKVTRSALRNAASIAVHGAHHRHAGRGEEGGGAGRRRPRVTATATDRHHAAPADG